MEQLAKALNSINLKIIKIDVSKQRAVSTSEGTMNVEKFCKLLISKLGSKAVQFPEVFERLHDIGSATTMLKEYAEERNILRGEKVDIEVPPEMKNLTLNLNLAAGSKDEMFFLTHPDETVSKVKGEVYLLITQTPPLEAASVARKVIPAYMPRGPRGVIKTVVDEKEENTFNVYTPPAWEKLKSNWKRIPDTIPPLFDKLVRHLFPIEEEREYFFTWLYDSLFSRSFVFLILCGAPGTGKNRLKLILRGLHGHVNTVDGKKSTLVEKFNSQLAEATLAWFDELHYDAEMENMMKELQNDSIAIERKGVDATKGTRIHSSIVISNNKPRDNYIAFDARKFAPLTITNKRLEVSMKPELIDQLTKKVEDETAETFDPEFLAQIVKWLKKRGRGDRWKNLEYRGPMFWKLAHTSMTRWQKKAVATIMMPESRSQKWGYDLDTGRFLWSEMNARLGRKGDRSMQFPDYTSVQAFFEVFRDGEGKKAFHTEPVKGSNIMGDFWVKPTNKSLTIITESQILGERGKVETTKKSKHKEIYDL